jgi:hypothetical protein
MRIPISLTRLFFMLMMLCSSKAIAQNTATLTIATTGSANLKIIFAGKKYNLLDRSCTFQNMKPGVYELIVYQMTGDKNPITPWKEVYNGKITLTAQKHLEVSILRFGKMAWDEGPIVMDDWGEWAGSNPVETQTGNGENQPASAAAFDQIRRTIYSQFGDEAKENMCSIIFKNNLLTANQLLIICKLLFDENIKLRVAKKGYDCCVDKENYFTLTELFFSSTVKNDFLQFLASK